LGQRLTSSRVTLVIARGAIDLLYTQPMWRSALGALGTLAIAAVMYWVLAAFIAISLFVVSPVITQRTLPAAFSVQPLLDFACISIAIYLWFFL
jgi:hypothetical protein